MTTKTGSIPFTGIPFPNDEYHRRCEKVFKAMERDGLDALLVTSHNHLRYLTGYSGYGGYFMPFPLVMVTGHAPTYVVREYEETGVRADSCIEEIVTYTHQPDWARATADVLRRYGVANKRVGLQLDLWNLAPKDVADLQAQLPLMKIVDASRLVPKIAAVKSDLELKAIREAMGYTDIAIRTFQSSIHSGVTEQEVGNAIAHEVAKSGGALWTPSTNIMFGERTKVPHGVPMPHPINKNEPAMIEVGGTKSGYAVGIVRSAVLGRHHEAEAVHALAVEALEAACAVIKAGATASSIDAAARKVVARSQLPRGMRHRAGYHTGPNWGGRGNLSLEPESPDVLETNMTFHLPIILFGDSDIMIGCSEHVLVTDTGCEILAKTPHTLHFA
ncbi:M24 family metallopeptidase [Caenimonas soli]|uniref:M24 family metallopeptidase n=1 Tax=Caenimonas soli TaxID=2735555 RepID=UPI0015558EDC|nr:Xaa-Pro peptidase family protein [Caenimonas soli]NPC58171.1 aminopeptidase P family protein [Caenimonas soli]